MISLQWYNYANKDARNVLAFGRMIKTLGGVSMLKSISGIYKIINKINGKEYIGSAVYIPRRWAQHRHDLRNGKHQNKHLQSAWNKYGECNFEFNVIEYCFVFSLVDREQYYINTLCPEYNVRTVANSNIGLKRSADTCKNISERRKGKGIGNTNALGKHWQQTKEHSEKIGKTKIGNSYGKGHKITQEHKDKLFEANKKRWKKFWDDKKND